MNANLTILPISALLAPAPVQRPTWFEAAALKPGDRVGISSSYESGDKVGTVEKINGYGHITLKDGRVFDKHGDLRNNKGGGIVRLCSAETMDAVLARRKEERERTNRANQFEEAVKKVIGGRTNGYNRVSSPISREEKDRLIALIEAL